MNKENKQRFIELLTIESKSKYPNMPDHARVIKVPTESSANALTKAVIKWIQLHGGQAERINTMGRMIDTRKVVTNVVGQQAMIGSMKYIPTTGTKGSADISAIVKSKITNAVIPLKIEIKYGKDRQSEAQKIYEYEITKAGGIYLIVRTFDDFVTWWNVHVGL
jgi:hypothetical protein